MKSMQGGYDGGAGVVDLQAQGRGRADQKKAAVIGSRRPKRGWLRESVVVVL